MKVLIQCPICKETFWVRGDSQRPNEYGAHEKADYEECCVHLQEDGASGVPIDCEVEDE